MVKAIFANTIFGAFVIPPAPQLSVIATVFPVEINSVSNATFNVTVNNTQFAHGDVISINVPLPGSF